MDSGLHGISMNLGVRLVKTWHGYHTNANSAIATPDQYAETTLLQPTIDPQQQKKTIKSQ
jgi:hypothetical protein